MIEFFFCNNNQIKFIKLKQKKWNEKHILDLWLFLSKMLISVCNQIPKCKHFPLEQLRMFSCIPRMDFPYFCFLWWKAAFLVCFLCMKIPIFAVKMHDAHISWLHFFKIYTHIGKFPIFYFLFRKWNVSFHKM